MDNTIQEATEYFRAGSNNIWKWSDDLQVIEWQSGETICYRKELMEILWAIQPTGLPIHIDSLILILAACKSTWNVDIYLKNLSNLHDTAAVEYSFQPHHSPDTARDLFWSNMHDFPKVLSLSAYTTIFETIQALPSELRSETSKQYLLYELFRSHIPRIDALKVKSFLQIFEAGLIDHEIKSIKKILGFDRARRMRSELRELNLHNLESRLRTGLEKVPEPLPIPLPDPIPQTDDLLTQLIQDPQTTGLARLAKRLIAALNIPPHTRGASDQPLGGVSDISNRGDYDRLLLSELANDDDTLSARLVNNEALYLRRETPPDPQVQERVLLVDVSLRLWGMPRVFAVAAALGCALNNPQKAKVAAFAVGKEVLASNALSSKEEVMQFLEKLSPALHPGEALQSFFRQNPAASHQSVFFITSEEVMADKAFGLMLADYVDRLNYLLVLGRSGELKLYKVVNGRRSLLSTSSFDLQALLFERPKPNGISALIEALQPKNPLFQHRHTLFLPTFPDRLRRHEVAFNEKILVGILPSRKVWLWSSAEKGAVEILPTIEEGHYRFYLEENELKCLIVYTPNSQVKAYLFQQHQLQAEVDFSQKTSKSAPDWQVLPLPAFPNRIRSYGFKDGQLLLGIIGTDDWGYRLTATHALDLATNMLDTLSKEEPLTTGIIPMSLQAIKSRVNNGYSVLRNIHRIGITKEGRIQLDEHQIVLEEDGIWLRKKITQLTVNKELSHITILHPHFYTRTAPWPNGCKIVVDSYGFLHFYYPEQSEVAFSITLIIGKPLAACSSDGYFTGNPYFYNTLAKNVISAHSFYKKYLDIFIGKIHSEA